LAMPPPLLPAKLPEIVELVRVRMPPRFWIPPPYLAELPERVELETVRVLPLELQMPPPMLSVVLPEIVELVTVRVPAFQIPPPPDPKAKPPLRLAVLPEMLELLTVRVPELLKAPPLLEVFAPETVTPEIDKSPPTAMLKMLKLRVELIVPEESSRPLIIREEEPGPVMVSVPTVVPVPPVPEAVALASKMVGSEALTLLFWESRVMVPVMLKLIISSPAVALALIIACLRDPIPESAVLITEKVEGTILCSRLRSSSRGEPDALRAFLFCELLKSLRKAFKSMDGEFLY